MSDILVRDLDSKIVGKLKAIAKRHGRSLQGEVKFILTEAVSFVTADRKFYELFQKQSIGQKFLWVEDIR